MSEDFTPEEMQGALERVLVRDMACTAVAALHAACLRYPEDVRAALGSLFDLSLWERQNRRLLEEAETARRATNEARHLMQAVSEDIENLEKRLDAVMYKIEALEKEVK